VSGRKRRTRDACGIQSRLCQRSDSKADHMGWRTDWLYQLIFDEVARIWSRAVKDGITFPNSGPPPDYLLIEECGDADWERAVCLRPVLRSWTCRGADFELQPQAPPEHIPPPVERGFRDSYGIVRFQVRPDRKKLVFEYILGPLHGRGRVFLVVGQGRRGKMGGSLVGDPGALSWIS
jgi:hypothetical protein